MSAIFPTKIIEFYPKQLICPYPPLSPGPTDLYPNHILRFFRRIGMCITQVQIFLLSLKYTSTQRNTISVISKLNFWICFCTRNASNLENCNLLGFYLLKPSLSANHISGPNCLCKWLEAYSVSFALSSQLGSRVFKMCLSKKSLFITHVLTQQKKFAIYILLSPITDVYQWK